MPACFQLLQHNAPVSLALVDAAICQRLELPWDESQYVSYWYDTIGFRLATGDTYDKIADYLKESIAKETDAEYREHDLTMLRILHFIRSEYQSASWYER